MKRQAKQCAQNGGTHTNTHTHRHSIVNTNTTEPIAGREAKGCVGLPTDGQGKLLFCSAAGMSFNKVDLALATCCCLCCRCYCCRMLIFMVAVLVFLHSVQGRSKLINAHAHTHTRSASAAASVAHMTASTCRIKNALKSA